MKTNVRSFLMTTQDAAPTKGERTRRTIIDSAYGLIISQGYAATSMRQIAERAGLALGGIYNHFPSKADVFLAILEDRHPFFQIAPILQAVPGGSVEEYVRNAARTLVAELGQYPEFLNLMLTEIVEFKAQHVPLLVGRMLPMLLPISERLSGLKGAVRRVPPPILVRAFLGLFFSYYITDVLAGQVFPAGMTEDALEGFVEIFLHGVLLEETA
jgi:AcrR family transcriptional regulator